MKYKLAVLLLILSLPVWAVPTRWHSMDITQPDGFVFHANFRGDAFLKLMTTDDGCAVIRNDDGFYCYASFDQNGTMFSTPFRVGDPAVPASVLSASRSIPLEIMMRDAARKRNFTEGFPGSDPVQRIRDRHPFATRSGNQPRHGIVILAQFQDVRFENTRSYFDQLLNAHTGSSAKDYFNDQFGGMFDFLFDVSEIVTVSGKMADYGKNGKNGEDVNPEGMIREACQLADAGIDFSQYDDDGDGAVDNVFVFFAGRSEADDPDKNADCIWPHAYSLASAGISLYLDGKRIGRYACASEFMRLSTGLYTTASIGTFCHEFTHTFGLPDFYDTDDESSGGKSKGLWGSTSLMDAGNYNNDGYTPPWFNAIERYLLGISEPVLLTEGEWTLEPIHRSGMYGIIPTDNDQEYYLVECRSNEKWDAHIGGSGLLVYHLDLSNRSAGNSTVHGALTAAERWRYNEVNAAPEHLCADLVGAIPGATSVVHVFWPQSGHTSFTTETDPAIRFWSGTKPGVAILDIRRSGDNITFRFVGDATERAPEAIIERQEVFQDAAIIRWKSSDPQYGKEAYIRYDISGRDGEEIAVQPYEPGKYAFTIEGLLPRTAYRAQIYFKSRNVPGAINEKCAFTTRSYYSASFPYIFLPDEGRNASGAFATGTELPLRVYNAPYAKSVSWFFDEEPVMTGLSGYWTISRSGILKARIIQEDGSEDIIYKEITVK